MERVNQVVILSVGSGTVFPFRETKFANYGLITLAEYFHLTRLSRSTACPGGNVTVLRRVLGLGFREACPGGHRPEKESTKAAGAPVPESLT